ncbi:hypothetical protein [Pygmaiobacter massiliensis]|uniref:hypothetical protein n=1 Tax=Pygmaiobacter massiliensis TaxID=1917873 RepID=UPI002897235D|nr:hypothetical protein [Pygmaiobacter massiliensis]
MNKNRVQYFESNDCLYGLNLDRIENLTIPKISEIDINDAIEFYEIKKHFDNGAKITTWSDEEVKSYKKKSKDLYVLTLHFFNVITDTTIIQLYAAVALCYRKEFWALFNICKLFEKISKDTFCQLIESEHIAPFDLFRYKNIVGSYGQILREYILRNDYSIRILIHVYEQDYEQTEKLFLPIELTNLDICSCLEKYIDSDSPNINTLNSIKQMRCTSRFPVSDELRLKAKRRHLNEIEKLSINGLSLQYGIELVFSPDQQKEKIVEQVNENFKISYSTQWFLDTLDYPSILNNFIYIFDFVDVLQMRSLHTSKESDIGIFERAMMPRSSRIYPNSHHFNFKNALATMQISAYYNFLKVQGIHLEDVLKWCFTEYLQSEYGCPEIRVSLLSESSTYSEKCHTLISALESVLRQFSLYVKNGEIDFELIEMSTVPISFDSIPSLVDKKYVYGTGKDYRNSTFMLFSDQCMYSHISRICEKKKQYDSFFDLISNEKVYLSDYSENDYAAFRYLSDNDLLKITDEGLISINSIEKVVALNDLYQNEVVNRWHYPAPSLKKIQELVEAGFLIEKSSLLSIPEANFLNYLLNRSEYDNGLEIRNKYVHGIQQVKTNEAEHMQNYMILLKIFMLLAIKINDDFELRKKLNSIGKLSDKIIQIG